MVTLTLTPLIGNSVHHPFQECDTITRYVSIGISPTSNMNVLEKPEECNIVTRLYMLLHVVCKKGDKKKAEVNAAALNEKSTFQVTERTSRLLILQDEDFQKSFFQTLNNIIMWTTLIESA